MKTPPIISPVINGKLTASASAAIRNMLAAYEGKTIRIEIKRNRKKRSLNQNAFYFGVVLPMVCGMWAEYGDNADPEVVHNYLKGEVGGMKEAVTAPDGSIIWHVKSSKDEDTIDWEKWMDEIRAWAAPYGLSVPYPNEII